MCDFSDLIMFSLRIVISAPDVCLGVYGGAWWLLTGLLIGHLVYVLYCPVSHQLLCSGASLSHVV